MSKSVTLEVEPPRSDERDKAVHLVTQAFQALLKPHGFRKSGLTWRLSTPDAICVVNVQRSNWGFDLYVNLGVVLRWFADIDEPREAECHLRARLEGVCPDELGQQVKQVAYRDLLENPAILSRLTAALDRYGLPSLMRLASKEGQYRKLIAMERGEVTADGSWALAFPGPVMERLRGSMS